MYQVVNVLMLQQSGFLGLDQTTEKIMKCSKLAM